MVVVVVTAVSSSYQPQDNAFGVDHSGTSGSAGSRDDLPALSVDSHVGDARLVMRGRVVMLDTHQVRMPYVRAGVVNAGGVIIAVKGERGGLQGRDGGATTNVDDLRTMQLGGRRGGGREAGKRKEKKTTEITSSN